MTSFYDREMVAAVTATGREVIEHTERAANSIAELAQSEQDQETVRAMCRNMAKLKLGKFDSIYDEYA